LEQWDVELRSVPSFEVWTDYKNLEYFQKKRQLSERQVRWAEILARYNFTLRYRPGKEAAVPDALSRREQDMLVDEFDERLVGRYFQLLKARRGRIRVLEGQTKAIQQALGKRADQDRETDDEADKFEALVNPFAENPLRELWEQALQANNRYWLIRQLVKEGARQFPKQWGLPISISECSIDEGGRLCWRDRIWLPFFEPLRTRVIQETHDSTLAGHPGRDLTKFLISRNFMWIGLSQDVRQFIRNCDVCGRTAVWREKKRGLLKPLPIPERI
jgi:hypothetical protein